MQNISQNVQTSYFQISGTRVSKASLTVVPRFVHADNPPGIHGRPYTLWNNVNGQFNYTGYCTHDSILFPTWHRPYLALFEVRVHPRKQAIRIRGFFLTGKLARTELARSNNSAPILRRQ